MGEDAITGLTVLIVLICGIWVVLSLNAIGVLLGLVGVILFFGAMVVAGEDSDFNAIHEW